MTGLTQEQVERAKRHITLLETYGSPWGNGLTRMSLAVVGESAGILRTLLSALPQPQESEREAARRDIRSKAKPRLAPARAARGIDTHGRVPRGRAASGAADSEGGQLT